MKYLVVARYKEDTAWLKDVPEEWKPFIIQKQTDLVKGDMPNAGREPTSFLLAIIKNYSQVKPDDKWAFVQANPFPHIGNFPGQLKRPVMRFTPLGGGQPIVVTTVATGKQTVYSEPFITDAFGMPHHSGLPVGLYYRQWFDKEFPKEGVQFYPGGQFMVTGEAILSHPLEFYQRIYDDVMAENAASPYVMERLWGAIFKL